ncbi:unnamed protein product [Lactuca virosa]|uniref:non-specific serine/threonine protein kinase n=1 Tax=Lactuca virosa TaxID=75947 RepID=A0AAU9LKK3_9ASTR|nr:unnamed protein product [Lactuca virosa]
MTLFVKYKGKSLSPSPNSPPVTVTPLPPPAPNSSPPSTSSPPPQSPPPTPTTQSPPPSTSSPPPSSPPPTSPPPPVISPPPSTPPPMSSPPPVSTSPPTNPPPPSSPTPPTNSSPPPASPPPTNTPPPAASPPPPATSPPPPTNTPPPAASPPPPATSPPPTNPPPSTPSPPPTNPPPSTTSPPPPATSPPPTNPPPSTTSPPPTRSPPPSSPSPPSRSPPPPPRTPSTRSPPSPSPPPPTNPSSTPPSRSPPPPPQSSSPPPTTTRPPPRTPPSSEPPTNSPPPPPVTTPRPATPSPPPLISASPPPSPPSPSTILPSPPGTPSNNDSSPNTPSNNGGIGTGGIIGISAVLALVLLTVIITVSCCIIKRKKKISRHNELYNLPTSMTNSPKSDSGLLKIQTSENENQFIYTPPDTGSGGFGYVYKGCLDDGTEVAVKELKIGGGQGEREFTAEVEIIGRIHHRYLVSLVGYCVSENNRLLVYEYVPNNTLYFHLHGSEVVLDWSTRVKVASGAARGIAYLHEDCHPRIIHRDIKSSNILLDKNFEARVSDFGLAKLAADLGTHITTRVMGTFGYMAPEYASSGKLTEKSDVYSFGVVLLELITGRKPVDASQPLGDESLVEWARPLLSHALETEDFEVLVDPKLGTNYVAKEMFHMIEAAAACVRHSAAKRPRMGQIVRAFESMETEDLSNGMRVGESEIFNSAQQSAEIRLFNRMAFGSQNYSTDFFTQGSVGPNGNDR